MFPVFDALEGRFTAAADPAPDAEDTDHPAGRPRSAGDQRLLLAPPRAQLPVAGAPAGVTPEFYILKARPLEGSL